MKKMNPAAKNMIQLLSYIVLMIGMWTVIGLVAFPKPTTVERLTDYVQKNENVLIQVADNAMDENVNPGIMTSVDVLEILGTEHISEVTAVENRAIFTIESDETPSEGWLHLIYLPDGQYAFRTDHPEEWKSMPVEEKNTLRWEDADGGYVNVVRLTDRFFLEEGSIHN